MARMFPTAAARDLARIHCDQDAWFKVDVVAADILEAGLVFEDWQAAVEEISLRYGDAIDEVSWRFVEQGKHQDADVLDEVVKEIEERRRYGYY